MRKQMTRPKASRTKSRQPVESDEESFVEKSPQPTIDAIRALVAFADAGHSVSEAARRLKSSQPVVSVKLKVFQAGDQPRAILLERDADGRSLRLTEAGRHALPVMREMVSQYEQLFLHLRGATESPRQLRIAVGAFGAEFLLPPVLTKVLAQPESDSSASFTVRTNVMRGRDRIIGVAEGKYDLAIVSHTPDQVRATLREAQIRESAIECQPLLQLPMIVAAGCNTAAGTELDRAKKSKPLPLEMLTQWPLVGPDKNSGIRRRLEAALPNPQLLTFAVEGGGWTAAREFARHGLGVAIIPQKVVGKHDQDAFVCRQLDEQFRLEEFVVQRTGAVPEAITQLLAAFAKMWPTSTPRVAVT